MNLDYIGAEQNFTVLAGVEPVYELEFERDGVPLVVDHVTFDGVLRLPDGEVRPLVVGHTGQGNVLRVEFPHGDRLGRYGYEIGYTTEQGVRGRLAFGVLQVLSSELLLEESGGLEFEGRRLLVKLPGVAGGHVQLVWRAGLEVLALVNEARAAVRRLAGVEGTLERVDAAVREFRVFTASFREDVASVLVLNGATGTIWVGGKDTGMPYQGAAGAAPRINAYGFWEVLEDGKWVTLPYCAVGKDGQDGASLRRVLLGGVDELPAGEVAGVLYYVPASEGYDVYAWVDPAGWLMVGADPYGLATEQNLGLVRLGVDSVVKEGAPVGMTADKRLAVPCASVYVAGAAKVSSGTVSDAGGLVHLSASGSLLVDMATELVAGAVRLGSSGVVAGGGAVGLNAAGGLEVVRASANQAGAVQLGSGYRQLCKAPYRSPVGEDGDGKLVTCLLTGGAVQCMGPDEWRELKEAGLAWFQDDAFPVSGAPHTGLVTSVQFRQSCDNGLELLPATQERLAGVYVTADADDARDDAVLPARRVALRDDVYSKADADARFLRADGGATRIVLCGRESIPPAAQQEPGVIYMGW